MNRHLLPFLLMSLLLMCTVNTSVAKDNESKGQSKQQSEKHEKKHKHDQGNDQVFFNNDRQVIIHNYYQTKSKAKNCPPGLAKKNNGCIAPGKVKKWQKGHVLPADVVYYDVPSELIVQIGRTPEGQKIVRVGTDLLLISIGTGMVIDAIQDLNDIF